MNIEQQCELVLKAARQEDAECKNRIKAIKKQLEQLSSELKTIGISNKWDELASLRNTINKRERELR
ncbi:hypothetical protein V5098_16200, partial [Vibrio coralliirubri]|uniref:hypothetical protein n=1 Tax=Vibrio coralliirubri TaxID=1516159 RepID=UPI002FD698C1